MIIYKLYKSIGNRKFMGVTNIMPLDLMTIIFQIINIIALVVIVVSLSLILYNMAKIIIKKDKNVDNNKINH